LEGNHLYLMRTILTNIKIENIKNYIVHKVVPEDLNRMQRIRFISGTKS